MKTDVKISYLAIARAAYANAIENAEFIIGVYKNFKDSKGEPYDPQQTLEEFDIVLQYSLMQIAVSNFNLEAEELTFIKNLTKYGDLAYYLDSYLDDSKWTWEKFLSVDPIILKSVIADMKEHMRNLADDFVFIFSIVDKITKDTDYSAILTVQTLMIVETVKKLGDSTIPESDEDCLMYEICNEIKRNKENFED